MTPRESPAPLVTTLLAPRLPPAHIRRPVLLQRLEQGTARPLTLICGPPGSGKTSLLCSWLQERSGAEHVQAAVASLSAHEAYLQHVTDHPAPEDFIPVILRAGGTAAGCEHAVTVRVHDLGGLGD